MKRESFAHFYLTRVAFGEGCACADAVRVRELDALSLVSPAPRRFPLPARLRRIVHAVRALSRGYGGRPATAPASNP